MEMADTSSQGKLDQLLNDGKITDEDYMQLSKAMEGETVTSSLSSSTAKRKLERTWDDAKIAGVCGGLAKYFRVEPVFIRVTAVILLFLAAPLTLLVYVTMYLVTPWDDEEAAANTPEKNTWWQFAIFGFFMLTFIPFLLSSYLLPRVTQVFAQLDLELNSITQWAIYILDTHNSWNFFFTSCIVASATIVYRACSNRKVKQLFALSFFLSCIAYLVFLMYGMIWPLFQTVTEF